MEKKIVFLSIVRIFLLTDPIYLRYHSYVRKIWIKSFQRVLMKLW